ncbi:hypothetical protein J1N35_038207 [Gossypium stocksii]|uniref:Uncharacterized protein n=1 Tax=Gossypium stocksii TaxID=47602 RepID=A0A9D3ULN2_9ROSI|nr:hypothetical protein J1N35_038207 [Gossypium stocksii]
MPSDDEEDLELSVEGEILVVKRSLNIQSAKTEAQRENIFHTRCHIQVKAWVSHDQTPKFVQATMVE